MPTHIAPRASAPACVVDLDNLLHRGRDKRDGRPRPRATLDLDALAAALHEHGVSHGIVCRNWSFSLVEDRLWNAFGFETRAVGANCDLRVIASLIAFADAGCRHLILLAGDADYAATVSRLRADGVRVEIWSRRSTVAASLAAVADAIRYVDDLIFIPPNTHPADRTRAA
jgi:hypothetical protein